MENNEERVGLEIDMWRIVEVLWRHVWVILLVGVLCGALAFGYARFFVTPTYSASVQFYVNNTYGENNPGFSSSQIVAAQDLAETYMVIMESRSMLTEVQEMTGLGYSYGQLKQMVSAASVNDTEIFQVDVVSTDYKDATAIANAIAEVLPDKIAAVVERSSVQVVDYAVENPNPVGPDCGRYAILGAVLGVVLSAAVVIVADLMDNSIYSEDYLVRVYDTVPLLAVIPGAENTKGSYKGHYELEKKRQPAKKSGGAA